MAPTRSGPSVLTDDAAESDDRPMDEHLSRQERQRWYVATARHAPSKHNAQPWRFALSPDGSAELYADAARGLAASDPDDRELTIGCGAALRTYVLAMRCAGYEPVVDMLPDGPDGALARVSEGAPAVPTDDDLALLAVVPARHSNRGPLDAMRMPIGTPARLQRAAETEGALLQLVTTPGAREALDLLVERARRAAALDLAFATELRSWTRPGATDGLPTRASRQVAMPYGARFAHPAYRRLLEQTPDAPLAAVLWTAGDDQADWLRAGMALQMVLLSATVDGASAALLSAPLERPSARQGLRRAIGYAGFPQAVLRVGVGIDDQAVATPRRSVDDLVG